jgi:hypothetical protein
MLLTNKTLARSIYLIDEMDPPKYKRPKKDWEKMVPTNVPLSNSVQLEVKKIMRLTSLSRSGVLRFLIRDGLEIAKTNREIKYTNSKGAKNYSVGIVKSDFKIINGFKKHTSGQVMRMCVDIGLQNIYAKIDIIKPVKDKKRVADFDKFIDSTDTTLPENDNHVNTFIDPNEVDTLEESDGKEQETPLNNTEPEPPSNDVEELEQLKVRDTDYINESEDTERHTKSISDNEYEETAEKETKESNVKSYNISLDLSLNISMDVNINVD